MIRRFSTFDWYSSRGARPSEPSELLSINDMLGKIAILQDRGVADPWSTVFDTFPEPLLQFDLDPKLNVFDITADPEMFNIVKFPLDVDLDSDKYFFTFSF
ncbi:hypothetical protein HYR53_10325 [Candidatus Acetothermia bacterium]|nr:hypothetical protein [Candidatus Acetothermia bacterium]